jgi:hypothetical protein
MLNLMRKIPHLLTALVLFLALPAQDARAAQVILQVPLFGQQTEMWCWATTLQMSVVHTGTVVSQCSQANARFGRNDCCNVPTPATCIQGGWPDYNRLNYNSVITPWGTALTFAQIQAEIRAGRPVNFSWGWAGGGGHIMVARGFDDNGWVLINDPWPVNAGATKWITYSAYVSAAGQYSHWQDYSGISSRVAERYVTVKGKQSSMLLNVDGGSTTQGARIIQWPVAGADNERWMFTATGDGYLTIKSKKSNLLLNVEGGGSAHGTRIVQWPLTGADNERWKLEPTAGGYFVIVGKQSGLALNVFGGSTEAGTGIVQWPKAGADNEKWKIE